MFLQAIEEGKVQRLLFGGEESQLTPANTDQLHDVISADLQASIELNYIKNNIDMFRIFVSHEKDLNKKR